METLLADMVNTLISADAIDALKPNRELRQYIVNSNFNGDHIEVVLDLECNIKYYCNGELHRDKGPAIEKRLGGKEWYQHGKLHRFDGPAVIYPDTIEWYQFGKKHRDNDLPAVEDTNGIREWWVNGKRHRICNPAVIYPNGNIEWWLDGNRLINNVKYD